MPTNKTNSAIKRKLMRLVLVTSGVVLFLTCASFFAYEFVTFRETSKNQLSTLGKIISDNSTAALAFDNHDDAHAILQALKAEEHIISASLYDTEGNLFVRYPDTISATMFPERPGPDGYHYVNGYLEGFAPVAEQGVRVGTLFLRSDLKGIYDRFQRYAMILIIVMACSVFVAFVLSNRMQKTISDPILALADTASRVSKQKDYTVRAKKYDEDEVGILTDAFNQMLSEIERQNEKITGFNYELEMKVEERTRALAEANTELKRKNDFVETIIDSSVDVIAVFDTDLHYVILNKYGKEMYGVEDENVIGEHILEVFPEVLGSPMHTDLMEAAKGKTVHNPTYRSRISGRILENFYIPLLDENQNVYSILVLGHDITELSSVNEKLRIVNNELEKSNLDLEQFAFVASHDLQEPLRKIQTYSQLAIRDIQDESSVIRHLDKVISSASRMTDLIKAVLNYSRLSGEKIPFDRVDLNRVVETIINDFELAIEEKGAEITYESLPVVYGNELQLNQLFLNLISNALKFSKRRPEIRITSAYLGRNNSPGNTEFAEIVFTDNGIGFDQQYADKIFNVFQRLHNRQDYPGTGIGLALCKKIIDQHHGRISVTSKPGEGTTFKMLLPVEVPIAFIKG
jgi:PAS domain S-box-containing protein